MILSFRRQVGVLLSGSIAAQTITFLSIPIVTRLYSPDEMGGFAIVLSFLGVAALVACMRYEQAIFIARTKRQIFHLMLLCVLLSMLSCALSYLVLTGLIFYGILGFSSLSDHAMVWIIIALYAMGVYLPFRAYALREGVLGTINLSVLVKATVQFMSRIIFALSGLGMIGLILAETLASICASGMLLNGVRLTMSCAYSPARYFKRGLLLTTKRFIRFPKFEFPSVLIDQLAMHAPVPILAYMFGAEVAGIYAITRLAIWVPAGQLGRAVGDVMQHRMAELVRRKAFAELEHLFLALLRKLIMLGLMPMLGIMLLAPPYLGVLLGEEWTQAGAVAAVISPWLFTSFVVSSLSRVISVLQRQDLKLVYDIFTLGIVMMVWGVGHHWHMDMMTFIELLAMGNVVGYILYLFLQYKAVRESKVRAAECAV